MAHKKNAQLTEETEGAGTGRKAALTLLITLCFVVLANQLAGRTLAKYTPNIGYWLIHEKWTKLSSMDEPVDWLVLGDSSCNQGVRPDVLHGLGFGPSVNLCTIGDMLTINDAWMVETYLARHPPPKGVIVVHVYDVWPRSANQLRAGLIGKIPLRYGFWDRLTPPVTLDKKQKKSVFLARYVPLYAENTSLAEWILYPSKLLDPGFTLDAHGYARQDEADPKAVRSDMQGHLRMLGKNRSFVMSQANSNGLKRISELAEQHGFDVYLANSPICEGIRRSEAFEARLGQMEQKLKTFADANPRVHLVLTDPPAFEPGEMVNCDHVTHEAAGVYTEKLAAAIQADIAARGAQP